MLKRPTQAQVKGAAAPAINPERAEVLAAHPLIKVASTGEILTPARVVEVMNGSPFNRDAAMLAIACLEGHGFARDAEADKGRGDKTVLMVNDGPDARVTTRLKPLGEGDRFGCYMDTITRTEYRVKVRQYMTKPASGDFDFHDKYNDGREVPMRVMVGKILEETRGMYKLSLYAKPEATITCMCCGRTLTNEMSQKYGIGPICIGKYGAFAPPLNDEELEAKKEELRAFLADVKWVGWIPKKSIEIMEEIKEEA